MLLAGTVSAIGEAAPAKRVGLPVVFERNDGQADGAARFLVRRGRSTIFFTEDDVVITGAGPDGNVLRLGIEGSNGAPEVVGEEVLPGRASYFHGNDPSRWHQDIPTFGRVRYRELSPGVDVLFHDDRGAIELDVVAGPGADLASVAIRVDGSDPLCLDNDGLHVERGGRRVATLEMPRCFEEVDGEHVPIEGRYLLDGNAIRFEDGRSDRAYGLIVDPVLTYSTYLGGTGYDGGGAIATDAVGNIYVTGGTSSTDFPLVNPFQNVMIGTDDIFVTKLDSSGSTLLYSTYIGGSFTDSGLAIAVDDTGAAYITGVTGSGDYPTVNPIQTFSGGFYDAFVTKLAPSGSSLVFSTYLGGTKDEQARGIAVDSSHNVYVAGYTESPNFPTFQPLQPVNAGGIDAFVTKIDATGSVFVFSTCLGGSGDDGAEGIAIDPSGSVYLAGEASSSDFPLASPLFAFSGASDVFISKLTPSGSALLYSTYLGGSGYESSGGIAVDTSGRMYVAGSTQGAGFPLKNAFDTQCTNCPGEGDAFVSCISAQGTSLVYSTYLGGANADGASRIRVDAAGDAYVTGGTSSGDFPKSCSIQTLTPADMFIARILPEGPLDYATHLGGTGVNSPYGVAIAFGKVYITGETYSTDFPTTANAYQSFHAGGVTDAFVMELTDTPCAPQAGFYGQPLSGNAPLAVAFVDQSRGTVTSHLWTFGDGFTSTVVHPSHFYLSAGQYTVTLTVSGPAGSDTMSRTNYVRLFGRDDFISGPGPATSNQNEVRILTLGGAVAKSWLAYQAGGFGTRVDAGDVDGTYPEVLTGPGPGPVLGPQARAFRRDGAALAKVNYYAYGTLKYGVNVKGGDVDGDGFDEMVTGAGPGAVFGPHVRGWNYDGVQLTSIAKISFFAYNTLKYGVNVAAGDIEQDGYAEILTGSGPGANFGPQARGFDYDGTGIAAKSFNGFVFVTPEYGVEVGAADVQGNGRAAGLYGRGPGPTLPEQVRGYDLSGATLSLLPGFDMIVFSGLGYGLEVGGGDLDANSVDEVICGEGPDPTATSREKAFSYSGTALTPVAGSDFLAFSYAYGVRVASAALGY